MLLKENAKTLSLSDILKNVFTNQYVQIFSFAILTAIAAQITIPAKPVPFTLQTMFVVLSGALLGAKKGAYSQLLYLTMGIIGLPVFAVVPEAGFGIARLFGPTGGYLLAFPLAAFFTGLIIEKNKNYFTVAAAMFLGDILIVVLGTLYLNLLYIHNLTEAFKLGAVIFSIWTVVKVFTAVGIFSLLKRN